MAFRDNVRTPARPEHPVSDNPYDAPKANVDRPADVPAVPDDVLKKIKNAWVAAVISGSITLIFTLIAMAGTSIAGITAWGMVDVALIFGLAYGIYRKSRTCAVVMLVYFVLSKILMMAQTGQPSGIVLAIVFAYYFAMGVAGTFQYHKLARD
jgi:serine/threonine-protein kinase